jgi:hypothetical protein
MLRLLADKNFNNNILHGLRRELLAITFERVQDCYLMGADDDVVLEWAANHGYVVVTHDLRPIPPLASQRVQPGIAMPGVIIVSSSMPTGQAIEEPALLVQCYEAAEVENNLVYLPL